MAMQDALKEDLAALEQEVLDEKLAGASHVPVHTPAGPSRVGGTLSILAPRDRNAALLMHCTHRTTAGGRRRRRRGATTRTAGRACDELRTVFRISVFGASTVDSM
jgi:hypothetical protein